MQYRAVNPMSSYTLGSIPRALTTQRGKMFVVIAKLGLAAALLYIARVGYLYGYKDSKSGPILAGAMIVGLFALALIGSLFA